MQVCVIALLFCGACNAEKLVTRDTKICTQIVKEAPGLDRNEKHIQNPKKKFVYIRHGKSAGNAGVSYAITHGLNEYKDGKLVGKGEQQAVARVQFMDTGMLTQIAEAGLLLVSPLSRTLATALILVVNVYKQCIDNPALKTVQGICVGKWPRVVVDTGLREKVKSDSERPGCGDHDPLAYVDSMAERLSHDGNFGDNVDSLANFREFVGAMKESYLAARKLATGVDEKKCVAWNNPLPEPTNGAKYFNVIADFKKRVVKYPEESIVMVAHSGWARYAFAANLPEVDGDGDKAMNLQTTQLKVYPLNNCGVAVGEIVESESGNGYFENVIIDKILPGNAEFPNTEKHEKVGVVMAPGYEAVQTGAFPADSCIARRGLQVKASRGKLASYHDYNVVLSWSPKGSALSWSSKWGDENEGLVSLSGPKATVVKSPSGKCTGGGSNSKVCISDGTHDIKITCSGCDMDAIADLVERFHDLGKSPCAM